jgi:hypothetical protein
VCVGVYIMTYVHTHTHTQSQASERAQYWEQQNQGLQEGLINLESPRGHFLASPRRIQALTLESL